MSRPAARRLAADPEPDERFYEGYLEMLALVERAHRLLLDVVKDELERLQISELNPVQGLILFNIGDKVMTAGELRSRGYYQGSNVSYNLKKLVEGGFIDHQRSPVDRRSVRIRLTEKGRHIHAALAELLQKQAGELGERLEAEGLAALNGHLRTVERFWSESIRYAY